MGKLRRAIFLLFVGIYLGVAPFTVLYALGYIFSPAQQSLIQTGLISLSTEPERAAVWVNGVETEHKTPLVLRNLKPGQYEIRLTLPGYHPWHRQVQVKPDRAFRFEKILLFPVNLSVETLSDFPIGGMWPAPGGEYLVVQRADLPFKLLLFDPEEKQFRLVPLPQEYEGAKIEEIYFHPGGEMALILIKSKGVPASLLVEFTDSIRVERVGEVFDESLLKNILWSTTRKGSVFWLKGNLLQRTDLRKNRTYTIFNKPICGFTLQRANLYVLDRKGRVLEINEKGKIRNVLLDDPKKANLIFGPLQDDSYFIYFLPSTPIFFLPESAFTLFISNKGKILSNKLPYFIDEDTDEVALASPHPRISYRKENEVWVVDFEEEPERTFFESGPASRKIYTGQDMPHSLHWSYEDRYIFFLEDNRLKIQDFEGLDPTVDLLEVSYHTTRFALDSKRGTLYFIEPKQDYLVSTKLPREGIVLAPPILTELVDGLASHKESSQ